MSENFVIRKAESGDFEAVFRLVQELAEYEKMTHKIQTTVEQFKSDGTANPPLFQCFIAVKSESQEVVAYAMYYNVYSSFMGKCIFLEDIYVTANMRGHGIGTYLYKRVAKEASETGCSRIDFIVLNWNQQALEFHKKHGAKDLTQEERWHYFRLDKNAIEQLAID